MTGTLKTMRTFIITLFFLSFSSFGSDYSAGLGFQYAFAGVKKTFPTEYVDLYASVGGGIALGLESKEIMNSNITIGANALLTPFFYLARTAHVKYHFGDEVNDSWAVAVDYGESISGAGGVSETVILLSVSHPLSW